LSPEDPSENVGRTALARVEDRVAIGDLPPGLDRRDDDLRVEAVERGGHNGTGDLAHARAAAGDVGRHVGPIQAALVGGAAVDAERFVGGICDSGAK
jgi:hypothetical protein